MLKHITHILITSIGKPVIRGHLFECKPRGPRGATKAGLSDFANLENDLGGSSETVWTTWDWMFTRRRSAIARRPRRVVCLAGRLDRLEPART
jgi:hypothetical protein